MVLGYGHVFFFFFFFFWGGGGGGGLHSAPKGENSKENKQKI